MAAPVSVLLLCADAGVAIAAAIMKADARAMLRMGTLSGCVV